MDENDDVKTRVRSKLLADRVKLWLSPYTTQDGKKGQDPEDLAKKYSSELGQPVEVISRVLEELRIHSVNKLATRKLKTNQQISLCVTLTGGDTSENIKATHVEAQLEDLTSSLTERIAGVFHVPCERLKLISEAKMLNDRLSLAVQGVRDGSQVLAVLLSEEEAEAARRQEQQKMAEESLMKTRQAAEILATRDQDDNRYSVVITDQSGKELSLPISERKSLVTAMALHEKGRALGKRKNYVEALVVLIEADGQFKQCRSDILQAVDNYAILCLDIVWCYWCLKNLEHLPDADARLRICQTSFEKSYGSNMERLMMLRGSIGMELVLYVRLYLLQAVTAYHQGRTDVAKSLLAKTESIAARLHVNEEKLAEVIAVGFSVAEARLALRAHDNNVAVAVSYLMEKREDKKRRMEIEKKEQKQRLRQNRYGKTADGSKVKVEIVDLLTGMGYLEKTAAEALKQANNDINLALQVLQDNPHLLDLPDVQDAEFQVSDELLAEVTFMGFDPSTAMAALRHHRGNVQRCVDDLLAGWVPPDVTASVNEQSATAAQINEEEREAVESLVPDLQNDEDDYLDLTLEEELAAIQEYRLLINTNPS
ncbi:NEDD8 ultimate buster 1-like isoform X1 [Corticium candelabrum]|uniref:NEDD8 ultimate buster 1-like isoform X1 n=2 Tax=Corticium candelabrum TaxID=121492 RepID=UPI002E26B6C4|nr:NEDD8 ultimate buster 1-like isoform X1 [Corticium candelabrum]